MTSPALRNNDNFQPSGGGYSQPFAETTGDVLTIENTLQKTLISFGVLLAAAAVGWFIPVLALPAVLIALVLGLVLSFKKMPSAPLTLAYAFFEGIAVGGISAILESEYPGVASQAVIATLCVVGAVLFLFANGKLRASAKATKIFMVAMIAYLIFSLVNFVIMLTGVSDQAWGLRSVEIFGIPLGLILGVFAVIMGAYSLVLDFDYVQNGVARRVPAKFGWTAAFGITLTVVWIYVEILRILAILRGEK